MPVRLLLVCAVVLCALSMGLRQSFGLFLAPMTAARGWTASAFALAIAAQVLLNGVSQPMCGNVADRIGGRRVLIAGWLLYAGGLLVMALAGSLAAFFLGAGLMLGVAVSAAGFPIVMASLSRLLPAEWRARATGLATAGSSFGQFSVVPLVQLGIDAFGWQGALVAMAAVAVAALPLALPLADRPAPPAEGRPVGAGAALREALATGHFWCLFWGFFVCGVHVSFLTVHIPGFVASCGLHPSWGATAISLIGLFNIAGSLASGELAGRWRRRELLMLIYAGRAAVMAAFLLGPKTEATLLLFSAAMGGLWLSTVPPTVALVARRFGTQWLATIFGLVFLGHQIGGFTGAWLGGVIWDRTGSYDLMWIIAILAGAFAAAVHIPMRDPRVPLAARAA
ncbi:MFS transporter [Elioraea sp. Yellowstone]|jgi:predicted MFS family arabinose efflux permease|uniref:MFS transporter n=1 Tax=Elioraea sp. Yellowstone TaxID=2592070 RepID=UPI00114D9105|nr:MFS transporter [Elioraea sp. Yellowstone]TQF77086.1 MFS transporter [Elioraea sp. Yellowstone]